MSATSDPFMADTPQLLTKTLTKTAAARVITAAGDTLQVDLLGYRIAWDERSSPRVQATLTCKVPDDVALLARIDARAGCRVELDLGYVRPDGFADVHLVADLSLRDRRVNRPANQMTLLAHSDESLLIDAAVCVSGTLNQTSTLNAITAVIAQVLPAAVTDSTGLPSAGPAVNQSQVDTDRWDTIADLADRINAKVYDDGLRTWRITGTATPGTSALTIAHGVNGTLVESDAGLSREEWANWVVLRYVWTDTSNVRQRIIGSRRVQTGPYAAVAPNICIYLEERNTPTTQAQADAAAAALVARMVTRGRSLRITAPAAYWLRPGDTITVQLVTGDPETHLVASIAFTSDGLMDITTRLPDNTGTIGA